MSAYILDTEGSRDPAQEGALDAQGQLVIHPAEWWAQFDQVDIGAFCVRQGMYCVPTLELVEWLKAEIGIATAIEVAAGNGALGRAVGIPATDNKSQRRPKVRAYLASIQQPPVRYGAHVLELDAELAVRALQPQVVVAAWLTHRFNEREEWRGGNPDGPREEFLLERARYIHVGNRGVHGVKPILALEHRAYEFPWLISRAMNGAPNFIAVWERGAGQRGDG